MDLIERSALDYRIAGHQLEDITNYNEVAVLRAMRELYARSAATCRCRTCVEDVYALALNSLPARYIQPTSEAAYLDSDVYTTFAEVRTAVAVAMVRVAERPRHEHTER